LAAGVLVEQVGPDAAADRLVDLTLRGGAPDNVSVVLADMSEAPAGGLGFSGAAWGNAGDRLPACWSSGLIRMSLSGRLSI
jgi:serine/threonine protein phosphatase PrpC